MCNKVSDEGAKAERTVAGGASWGFMHSWVNHYSPLQFNGAEDDPTVYHTLKRLTTR